MVEEAAEGPLAEGLVVLGVQDELVPQVVGDLRGHRHRLQFALQVREDELAQSVRAQAGTASGVSSWIVLAPPVEQAARTARNQASLPRRRWRSALAEAVRFELTDLRSPVFKTGALDHSATLPGSGRRILVSTQAAALRSQRT